MEGLTCKECGMSMFTIVAVFLGIIIVLVGLTYVTVRGHTVPMPLDQLFFCSQLCLVLLLLAAYISIDESTQ
jgi:hypothetical protein